MNDSKSRNEDFERKELMRQRSEAMKNNNNKESGLPDDPKLGNGHSEGEYYYVEARVTGDPRVIPTENDRFPMILTDKWQRVPTYNNNIGLGVLNLLHCPVAQQQQLLTYEAARAIEYQFAAGFGFASCIETRLMFVKLVVDYSMSFIGYAPITNCFEDGRQLGWKIKTKRKEAVETHEHKIKLQELFQEESEKALVDTGKED